MKEDKLVKYLFSTKNIQNETLEDKQKYDSRLLGFLSSDKVMNRIDFSIYANVFRSMQQSIDEFYYKFQRKSSHEWQILCY